jgi:5-methylcytosine-specific restriction protein A
MPIPDNITTEHVLEAARRIDAGAGRQFGSPTKYEVVIGLKAYPPKALIGLAAGLATGVELGPSDFSSGLGARQAVGVIKRLGFEVRPIERATDSERSPRTYLLVWNPNRWTWTSLAEDCDAVRRLGAVRCEWTTGNTRRITVGDGVFLIMLGQKPRGIVARGTVASRGRVDTHWDDAERAKGATVWTVKVDFTELLDPREAQPLDVHVSSSDILRTMNWSPQASGHLIPDVVATELTRQWMAHVAKVAAMPDDLVLEEDERRVFVEGGSARHSSIRYERNRDARNRCLRHWGTRCACCEIDLGERYGELADGFIHVHHLSPLAEAGGERAVDPIKDLRPVCPNCHAVIHLRVPPLSIETVREKLRSKHS